MKSRDSVVDSIEAVNAVEWKEGGGGKWGGEEGGRCADNGDDK